MYRDAYGSVSRSSMESQTPVSDTDSVLAWTHDTRTQGTPTHTATGQDPLRHVNRVLGVGCGEDEWRVRDLQGSWGIRSPQGGVHAPDRAYPGRTAPGPSVQQPGMCEPRSLGACHAGREQPAHVGSDHTLPQRSPQDAREYDVQEVRGPRMFRVQPRTRTSQRSEKKGMSWEHL